MRTLACLAAASILALAPRLASAQEAGSIAPQAAPAAEPAPPPVVVTPPAAGATVVILPQPPAYAPPPVAAYAPPVVWQPSPTGDPPAMRRRSKGLMIAGLIMVPVGLTMAIGGGIWAHDVESKPSECTSSGGSLGSAIGAIGCGIGEGIDRGMSLTAAYTLAVLGGGTTIAGAVMAIAGAQMVPAKQRWQPNVRMGAGSATLTWQL